MAKVIAGMTISLDGFVADSKGSVSDLYPDLISLRDTDYMRAAIDETGAVLMGRNTFDMAGDPDSYVGNYEFQVPIFVVTHNPPESPPKQDERLTFTFVTNGSEAAAQQAKTAAKGKAVTVVGGPGLIQQLLQGGLVDELRIDVMPVILGAGLALFGREGLDRIPMRKISVEEIGPRTSLRFERA